MKITLLLVGLIVLIAFVSADHHGKATGSAKTDQTDQKEHAVKKSAKKLNHDHEKAKKGKSEVVLHKKEDVEKGGKKHHSFDEGNHHSQKHNDGHASHGANFKQADHQKKSKSEKGFREQYHKDEHKKSDRWFSNNHKSGEWLKFGSGKVKHHAYKHDKDVNGKYSNGKHSEKRGKEQKFTNGLANSEHKGHKSEHGGQSHYSKHEEFAKKKNHAKHA